MRLDHLLSKEHTAARVAESLVSKLRNRFESCVSKQEILFNFEVPGDRDFKEGQEWQPEPHMGV